MAGTKQITITLPQELLEKIRRMAAERDRSISNLIAVLVKKAMGK